MGTEINASAVLSTASCVYNLKISLHMQNVQAAVPEGFVPEVILLLLILLLVVTVVLTNHV